MLQSFEARRPGRLALALALAFVLGAAALGLGQRALQAYTPEPGSEQDPLVARSYVDQWVQFQVVSLGAGQRLEAAAPGVEIVVRVGRVRAVASPAGGLVDATDGRNLGQGETVSPNHLIIVPRADGRGVEAAGDVIAMVRGPHVVR
ncbi:MAG: hypothetical protein K6T75_09905 [Acetobacteraceae bacterium]|nr:hypothetical protein [Acetobacteraceae bacterium]